MHWIHVESSKWTLKSAVIGMRGLSGNHGGKNLGRYIAGLCDRVGLIGKARPKVRLITTRVSTFHLTQPLPQLEGATLDNTSSNTNICKTIAQVHKRRGLKPWNHHKKQFMYVCSLAFLLASESTNHSNHPGVLATS